MNSDWKDSLKEIKRENGDGSGLPNIRQISSIEAKPGRVVKDFRRPENTTVINERVVIQKAPARVITVNLDDNVLRHKRCD